MSYLIVAVAMFGVTYWVCNSLGFGKPEQTTVEAWLKFLPRKMQAGK